MCGLCLPLLAHAIQGTQALVPTEPGVRPPTCPLANTTLSLGAEEKVATASVFWVLIWQKFPHITTVIVSVNGTQTQS